MYLGLGYFDTKDIGLQGIGIARWCTWNLIGDHEIDLHASKWKPCTVTRFVMPQTITLC